MNSKSDMDATLAIDGPTVAPDDPLYLAECLSALEPCVSHLIDMATAAGWTRREVASAIIALAFDMDSFDTSRMAVVTTLQ